MIRYHNISLGVLFSLVFFCSSGLYGSTEQDGKVLFTQNCKACHSIDTRLVGPPLKGVTTRRDSLWLHKFISSSQGMIQSGDSIAVAIYNEYNKVIMPDQKLGPDAIEAILEYINTGGAAVANQGAIARPDVGYGRVSSPLRFTHYSFWLPYTVTVILLIVLLWYMAEVTSMRTSEDSSDSGPEE